MPARQRPTKPRRRASARSRGGEGDQPTSGGSWGEEIRRDVCRRATAGGRATELAPGYSSLICTSSAGRCHVLLGQESKLRPVGWVGEGERRLGRARR